MSNCAFGLQGGFDLNAETAKLAKAIGATLKSKSKKLKKNRSSSLKQVQAILGALG